MDEQIKEILDNLVNGYEELNNIYEKEFEQENPYACEEEIEIIKDIIKK